MVARMVWPAMVVLLILAVAGPCLTFYLLIKDYWAEVSSLRRDLLFCQLGSTDLPFSFDLDLDFPPTTSFPPPLPQAPQPLVATTAAPIPTSTTAGSTTTDAVTSDTSASTTADTTSGTTETIPSTLDDLTNTPSAIPVTSSTTTKTTSTTSTTTTSAPTTKASPTSSSTESPSQLPPTPSSPAIINALDSNPQDSPKIPNLPHTSPPSPVRPIDKGPSRGVWPSYRQKQGQNPSSRGSGGFLGEATSRGRGWAPTRPPRSLDRVMSDDDPNAEDTAEADQEYVTILERQLRDLRARVKACRSCLTPPQRTMATCGGGMAWREHRKRERQLRNRQRAQRRERRRRIKDLQGNETTTESPTTTTTTTEGADPINNPLQADVTSWFSSESETKSDNHRARQNHRMSTDFRRGFNQKISRMDEALMQFTDTQAAFCKELRDNLGGRLEKRGQELGALSNQIAALVRTSTMQINELEKVASNQLYSSQASIEKSILITQAIRDSQIRAIQSYHKQTFLPAAGAIATILSDQASAATSMGVELITKVEMLQDIYLTYATQQGDTLQKVIEEVDMFASKHNNLVMRSKDHANHFHTKTESFIRELQTRMNNVVKELVLIRLQSQNFVSVNNNTHNDIFSSLNKTEAVVDNLSQGLRHRVQQAKEKDHDFRKTFKMETNQISDRVESGVSQALASNHASIRQIQETELDTRVYVGSAVSAWNELYSNQESELRLEADDLTNSLRSHTHHTQNVLHDLRSAAETHEQVLEEQRMDFQRFVRKRQDALDTQCSAITDWAMLMSSELRRRDEDLHKFLNEDLRYTTVTVHEDTDGYLVSRLPDGSLVYQSSPAHAAHPPPNVTYQLEETVYSTEPASSTSHSSPKKPQLEKTVITPVNSTHSSLRDSINLGKKDSNTSSSSNSSSSKNDNETTTTTTTQSEEYLEDGWKLTEKYDVLEEQNNRISDVYGEEKEKIDFSHHSKTTRSEGSSLQGIKDTKSNVINIETSIRKNGKGSDDTHEESKTEGTVNQTTIDNATNGRLLSSVNATGARNGTKRPSLVLKRRRGELLGSKSRQNDGAYKPQGVISCGGMTVLHSQDDEYTSLNGRGTTNDHFYDDDDIGIRKLRKILREAQKTIQKFQKDFQIDDSFRKNKPPLKLWESLKNEQDLIEDELYEMEKGATNETSIVPDNPITKVEEGSETPKTGKKEPTSSSGGKETGAAPEHRVRHQHHKTLRRMQWGSSRLSDQNPTEQEESDSVRHAQSSIPTSDSLPKDIEEITPDSKSAELPETLIETSPTKMHEAKIEDVIKESNSSSMDVAIDGEPDLERRSIPSSVRQENETTTVRSTEDEN